MTNKCKVDKEILIKDVNARDFNDEFERLKKDFNEKSKKLVFDTARNMSCIDLGEVVNKAINNAIQRMQKRMLSEGKHKLTDIRWDHVTYATKEGQFKLDQSEDKTWYITSELTYLNIADYPVSSINDLESLIVDLRTDYMLIDHLEATAKKDEVDKFLED
jgi:hypothetical protein